VLLTLDKALIAQLFAGHAAYHSEILQVIQGVKMSDHTNYWPDSRAHIRCPDYLELPEEVNGWQSFLELNSGQQTAFRELIYPKLLFK
jgi:hypothetical protein